MSFFELEEQDQQVKEERAAFAQALAEYDAKYEIPKQIKIGTQITGTLVSKTEKYAFVDFHGKNMVRISNSGIEKAIIETLEIGTKVSVLITEVTDRMRDGFTLSGSLAEYQTQEILEFLQSAYEDKKVLTGRPVDMNHAGYNVIVNINDVNIMLFMPHLLTDVNKLVDSKSVLDTDVEFMLEYVKKEGNASYIASRKKYLETLIPDEMGKLVRGGVYDGIVTGKTDFAVFVQFNGVLTGMIHKTNLLPEVLELMNDIKPGYPIQFYVKDVVINHKDVKKNRVFLTQVERESLWDSISTGHKMAGKVVAVKDFGLMISLDFETKGLLHKSVLDRGLTEYKIGEMLDIRVTNVNKNNRQITLALQKK